jgi:hypothetical protein
MEVLRMEALRARIETVAHRSMGEPELLLLLQAYRPTLDPLPFQVQPSIKIQLEGLFHGKKQKLL